MLDDELMIVSVSINAKPSIAVKGRHYDQYQRSDLCWLLLLHVLRSRDILRLRLIIPFDSIPRPGTPRCNTRGWSQVF